MVDSGTVKEKVADWLLEKFELEPQFFLVDVKLQGRKLSVFLDGDNGIEVGKCAEFSRYLERKLDDQNLLGDNYVLEVSSPGMDNPFKNLRQYSRHLGKVVTVIKFDGQRIDGILKKADEDGIEVEVTTKVKGKAAETKMHEILLKDIKSTKLYF